MQRREWLKRSTLGAGALGLPWLLGNRPRAAEPQKKLSPLKIIDVKTILTAPANIRLVVVKVMTNEPGLYGLGCATFTQRARTVETAVDRYLKPFLLGKDPLNIDDVWQSNFVSSYWRNGPVLGNAISGVDIALWDILGKRAGLPVYQLFGGKCRDSVDTYRHASGRTFADVEKAVRRYMDEGYRHVRVQVSVPGLSTYGAGRASGGAANNRKLTWEPGPYVRVVPKLFEYLRKQVGDEVELLHDTHERVPPILAIKLAKDLEQFRPFFLEDPLSPEDVGYFKHLRSQTSTPIAMGELFNNPNEWLSLVSERLIDFIRIHISQIGGLSPARKVAALSEFFGVRTAWHGPGDASPLAHAAQLAIELSSYNFGVHEGGSFPKETQEVFVGCPELKNGYLLAQEKPGLGIEVDEKLAAKFPIPPGPPNFDYSWGTTRRRDGTVIRP
jgi:mannonate dehydratase